MAHLLSNQSLWVSSCVCKDDEVGDGRACYGHLLHEIQRAKQNGLMVPRLRAAVVMLGVCPLGLPVTTHPVPTELGWRPSLGRH